MQTLTPEEATKQENNIIKGFCLNLNAWAKRENENFDYNSHPHLLLQVVDNRHLGREVLINKVPVFRTWRIRAASGAILGVASRFIVGDWTAEIDL